MQRFDGSSINACVDRLAREIAGDILSDEGKVRANSAGWADYRIRNWSEVIGERIRKRAKEILVNGEMKNA